MKYLILSGRQDSNLRPPGPKPGAMTGLRYAPKLYLTICIRCGETGTRTQATVTRRQISNLLRYHSGTSPILKAPLLLRLQMYNNFLFCTNILETFLYIFYQSNNYQILKNSKIFFISIYLGGKTIP